MKPERVISGFKEDRRPRRLEDHNSDIVSTEPNSSRHETLRELATILLEQAAQTQTAASTIDGQLFGFRPEVQSDSMNEPESIEDLMSVAAYILREANIKLHSVRDRLS